MFHNYQVTVRTWTTGKLSRKENWRRSANSEFRTATHPDLLVFSSSVCGFFLVCQMPFACPLFFFFFFPYAVRPYGLRSMGFCFFFFGSTVGRDFRVHWLHPMPCFAETIVNRTCKQAARHVIHIDEIMTGTCGWPYSVTVTASQAGNITSHKGSAASLKEGRSLLWFVGCWKSTYVIICHYAREYTES